MLRPRYLGRRDDYLLPSGSVLATRRIVGRAWRSAMIIDLPTARLTTSSKVNPDSDSLPRVGVPNNGRLSRQAIEVLGLPRSVADSRSLVLASPDAIVYRARSSDLPFLLVDGLVDMVITGRDYVAESRMSLKLIWDLRIQSGVIGVVGLPGSGDWRERRNLVVASQYPKLADSYMAKHASNGYEIVAIMGAAELFAYLRVVDVIVDALMTGETAAAHGLVLHDIVMPTSGGLFVRHDYQITNVAHRLIRRLKRIRS